MKSSIGMMARVYRAINALFLMTQDSNNKDSVMTKTKNKPANNGRWVHQVESQSFWMTAGELSQVEVYRASEREDGFQRVARDKKIHEIAKHLEVLKAKGRNSDFPEILIANVNGKLICIDGQHRLAAHIQVGMNARVHVESMSLNDAVDRFIRDNGKSTPLRKPELAMSARTELAKQIRALAKTYNAGIPQVMQLLTGMRGALSDLVVAGPGLTDQENRTAGAILEVWTRDDRWLEIDDPMSRGSSVGTKKVAAMRKTIEWAYSSTTTMYALGAIGREGMSNINKLKKDIRIVQDADWKKALEDNSMRGLARKGTNKKKLFEYMKSKVLMPAYRAMVD